MSGVQATALLDGTGRNPAILTISDSDPYNFGIVVNSNTVTHTFTITNTGDVDATAVTEVALIAPYSFAGGGYPGTGGDCVSGGVIAASGSPGDSCTIEVAFNPTVAGFQTDDLELSYHNGVIPSVPVDSELHGTGLTPALLAISESDPYDYGSLAQGGTKLHTFYITNNGGETATVMGESGLGGDYSLPGGYPGTGGDCGPSLATGLTCSIVAQFNPSGVGLITDTINIDYNDGTVTPAMTPRDVEGTGITPAVSYTHLTLPTKA